jgi:hypothetical protein
MGVLPGAPGFEVFLDRGGLITNGSDRGLELFLRHSEFL